MKITFLFSQLKHMLWVLKRAPKTCLNWWIRKYSRSYAQKFCISIPMQDFFQQFWEKAPGQNWEKMINLTAKLGEIKDIEHNKGGKIYPQNQVILDCTMPTIQLKHKSLSFILIWVIVSHK